jgi:hypothetical protein
MVKAFANPFNGARSDADATWGVKKVVKGRPLAKYGYKLHVVVDANNDLPLVEMVTGATRAIRPCSQNSWQRVADRCSQGL